jgi:tetratricopeptide (TPR) repeat protein
MITISNFRVIFLTAALCLSPALWAQDDKDPALEEYFVANAAYNRKLYPVAIGQYESFLKKNATHPKADLAHQGAGLSQYALKQYDKAIPHFAALLVKGNLDAEISRERIALLQGRCLMFTNRQDEAKKLFVAEFEKLKDPAMKTTALVAICDISFGKSDWQEVLAWAPKLLAAAPDPNQAARGLYQQGFAQFQLKKYAEVAAPLAKIAELKADAAWQARAAYLLGESHSMLKEFGKAESAYAAALPGMQGADAADCRYRLALARFSQGKHEPALADLVAYTKEAKPDPEKPLIGRQLQEARLLIARCKLELKDYKAADKDLQPLAIGDDLGAAQANLWWARVHSRQNQYDRAAEILEPATAKFQKLSVIDDLNFDFANALMNRKEPDWKKAGEVLQRIENSKQFGQLAEVLLLRSICFHKLADYANSMRYNETYLQRFPEDASAGDVRFMRAENLFLLNRTDEAAAAYGDFMNRDKEHPKHKVAALRIAQIFHGKGEWAKALATAGPLLAQKPEGPLFAQLSFVVGDCYFRQEKWAEAIPPLENFVATYDMVAASKKHHKLKGPAPLNVDTALMQLAVAHLGAGNTQKALQHLNTITDVYPWYTSQLPIALTEQGRLAFEAGDLKLARHSLERFFAEAGKNAEPFKQQAASQLPKATYYLAWVEASEGKHEVAAQRFSEVPKGHELAADARLQQGIALVKTEKFEESAKLFPEILKQFPEHEKRERLVYYAGLSFARLEKWKEASGFFAELVGKYPSSEFADKSLYEWAWCEQGLGRKKEASELYEKMLAAYPKSELVLKVRSELANLNLDAGSQDKVIAELTETLTKVEDEKLREDIRYQLASAHFNKGDHATAAVQLEKLLVDYPESKMRVSILFLAGESRLQLTETATARDHFAAAAGLIGTPQPKTANAPTEPAKTRGKKGAKPDPRSANIAGTPPELAESILMRLGETQSLTGEHKAAQETYKKFLSSFPESRWTRNAQFGLGFALEMGGNPKAAIPEYAKLLTADVVDLWTVRARFQTGECHFNQQEYDKAVTEFVNMEINFSKYPDWQAKAALEIGRVLLAQGKREEAEQRLKDVIRKFSKEKAAIIARQLLDKMRDS